MATWLTIARAKRVQTQTGKFKKKSTRRITSNYIYPNKNKYNVMCNKK